MCQLCFDKLWLLFCFFNHLRQSKRDEKFESICKISTGNCFQVKSWISRQQITIQKGKHHGMKYHQIQKLAMLIQTSRGGLKSPQIQKFLAFMQSMNFNFTKRKKLFTFATSFKVTKVFSIFLQSQDISIMHFVVHMFYIIRISM